MLLSSLILSSSPAEATVTIPGIASSVQVTTGSATFGCRLTNAGDLNADGYDDLAVSDCSQRRVYVYYGSSSGIPTSASVTLTGPIGSRFGWSMDGDGDVNGDGYADLVVGAPDAAGGRGCVYVFHGGASLSTTATLRCGSRTTDHQGGNVAIAGDVDADGYDDVVTAPEYGGNGRLALYRGGAAGVASAASVNRALSGFTGDTGESLRRAGDVNGDGLGDIVLGSPHHNGGEGAIRVYLGTATGGFSAYQQYTSTSYYGVWWGLGLGQSVSGGGDIDGDGYDDVLAGGTEGYYGYDGYGYVLVFNGDATGFDAVTVGLTGGNYGDSPAATGMGWSVSGPGDQNADGYPDIGMGSPGRGAWSGTVWGSAQVVLTEGGLPGWTASPFPYIEALGPYPGGPLGMSVSTTGDFDGDGCDDIATTIGDAPAGTAYASVFGAQVHLVDCPYSGDPEYSPE